MKSNNILKSFINTNTGVLKSERGMAQEAGLLVIILLVGAALSIFSGSHIELIDGKKYLVNNFLNPNVLMQIATDASFFAIMAVGVSFVIITCGIDLSVGSIYALSGVAMAMALHSIGPMSTGMTVMTGIVVCLGIGLLAGVVNGLLVVGLKVHPFVITLGSMWVLRGIAYVATKAESKSVPQSLIDTIKAPLGFGGALHPVPMLVMFAVMIAGAVFLTLTVPGRHVFAIGGNVEASRFAGLRINRTLVAVYALSGLAAGIAAFLGVSYYGSASCGDGTGYELYVIASAVVGGTSLTGGKGSAISAVLGALLIIVIRQAIVTLQYDQKYEWIIIGCAVIVAVVIDQFSAKMMARRMALAAGSDKAAA